MRTAIEHINKCMKIIEKERGTGHKMLRDIRNKKLREQKRNKKLRVQKRKKIATPGMKTKRAISSGDFRTPTPHNKKPSNQKYSVENISKKIQFDSHMKDSTQNIDGNSISKHKNERFCKGDLVKVFCNIEGTHLHAFVKKVQSRQGKVEVQYDSGKSELVKIHNVKKTEETWQSKTYSANESVEIRRRIVGEDQDIWLKGKILQSCNAYSAMVQYDVHAINKYNIQPKLQVHISNIRKPDRRRSSAPELENSVKMEIGLKVIRARENGDKKKLKKVMQDLQNQYMVCKRTINRIADTVSNGGEFYSRGTSGKSKSLDESLFTTFLDHVRASNEQGFKKEDFIAVCTKRNRGVPYSTSYQNKLIKTLKAVVENDYPDLTFGKKKFVSKNKNRQAAEYSPRRACAFSAVALVTLAIPVADNDCLSNGSCTSSSIKYPHVWVKSSYILSTDETTFVVRASNCDNNFDWYICKKRSSHERNKNSSFINRKSKAFDSIVRIRWLQTCAADGRAAPLVFIVKLTGEQWGKMHKNVVAMPVKGLSPGGVLIDSEQEGFIVFANKSIQNVEAEIANWYEEFVKIPWINNHRKKTYPHESKHMLRAVSWSDGAVAPLKVILSRCENDLATHNVVHCKHNASRSLVEQPMDLMASFKAYKSQLKKRDWSQKESTTLRASLENMMQNMSDAGSKIAQGNKNLMINFFAEVPRMAQLALKREHLIKGFLDSGLISQVCDGPDIDKMLRTCTGIEKMKHGDVSMLEFCKSMMPMMVQSVTEIGEVKEKEIFDEFGFPLDRSRNGQVVERVNKFTSEWECGAKFLSHSHAMKERKKIKEMLRRKVEKKKNDQIAKKQLLRLESRNLEAKLSKLISDKTRWTQEFFKRNATVSELKAFLMARLTKDQISIEGGLMKKKVPLARMAEKFRCESIIPLKENTTEMGNNAENFNEANYLLRHDSAVSQDKAFSDISKISLEMFYVSQINRVVQIFDISRHEKLIEVFETRLQAHILKQARKIVAQEKKDLFREHIVWRFVRQNIDRMVHILMALNLITNDINDDQLLRNPYRGRNTKNKEPLLPRINDFNVQKLAGAYVFYCKRRKKYVRSGKAKSMLNRWEQHQKNANKLEEIRNSDFYKRYPGEDIITNEPEAVKSCEIVNGENGTFCFNDLECFAPLAFDLSNQVDKFEGKSNKNILDFSIIDRGGQNIVKRMNYASYLFELILELAIDPKENLSTSCGFEKYLITLFKETKNMENIITTRSKKKKYNNRIKM